MFVILDLLFWLPSCPQQLRIIFSEGCFRLAEGEIKMSLERIEAGVDDKEDENGLSLFSETAEFE